MLNLFLNTHSLLDYHKTGIPHYTWHLFKGMIEHAEINSLYTVRGNRLVTYYPAKFPNKNSAVDSIFKFLERTPLLKHYISKLTTHSFDKFAKKKAGSNIIYVEPNFIVNPYKGRCVPTLHDLTCLRFPHLQPVERAAWFEKGLSLTLQQATHIISVSEFTRQEAIRYLNIAPEKITAIYNGVSADFHPRSAMEIETVLKKYQLTYKKYLLSVSTLEPRKNLNSLVQGYLQLSKELRQEYPLVLAGAVGWKVQDLMKKIKNSEQIFSLGYIPQNELTAIFAGATAFCYLSTYEGFGLPVLEALASGVPVLTSADSAMAEFSKDQAMLVNPLDIDAITQGLRILLLDETLAAQTLAKANYYRENFSWNKCVNNTVRLLAELN